MTIQLITSKVALFLLFICSKSHGFRSGKHPTSLSTFDKFSSLILLRSSNKPNNELGGNTVSRVLFRASEIFGKISQVGNSQIYKPYEKRVQGLQITEMSQKIKKEYESIFWATGEMDMSLWEDNCTFADPFSSFGGPGSSKRFRTNANNLGKLVKNPTLKITNFSTTTSTDGETVVTVGWNFKSKLKLPWNPILAAAGETKHYLNKNTNKIQRYEESWKSKPVDVILRLFTPT